MVYSTGEMAKCCFISYESLYLASIPVVLHGLRLGQPGGVVGSGHWTVHNPDPSEITQ